MGSRPKVDPEVGSELDEPLGLGESHSEREAERDLSDFDREQPWLPKTLLLEEAESLEQDEHRSLGPTRSACWRKGATRRDPEVGVGEAPADPGETDALECGSPPPQSPEPLNAEGSCSSHGERGRAARGVEDELIVERAVRGAVRGY